MRLLCASEEKIRLRHYERLLIQLLTTRLVDLDDVLAPDGWQGLLWRQTLWAVDVGGVLMYVVSEELGAKLETVGGLPEWR